MEAGTVKRLRLLQLLCVLFVFQVSTNYYHLVLSSIAQTTIPSPLTNSLSIPPPYAIWASNGSWYYQLCHTDLQHPSMPAEFKCICGRDFTQLSHFSRHQNTCENQQEQTKDAYKRRQKLGGRIKRRKLDDDDRNRIGGPSSQTQRETAIRPESRASSHVSYIS